MKRQPKIVQQKANQSEKKPKWEKTKSTGAQSTGLKQKIIIQFAKRMLINNMMPTKKCQLVGKKKTDV